MVLAASPAFPVSMVSGVLGGTCELHFGLQVQKGSAQLATAALSDAYTSQSGHPARVWG